MAFHKGEIVIQEKAGVRDFAQKVGRVMINTIIPGAIAFIENQNTVVLSSSDVNQNIWVSMIMGDIGFVQVPDSATIRFNKSLMHNVGNDVLFDNLSSNEHVGGVFIELGSRRRFRVNGKLHIEEKGLCLVVEEAFANCPKYIQRRLIKKSDSVTDVASDMIKGTYLNDGIIQWISQADTFFVGSKGEEGKLDVNHRGGNKGFIEIVDGNRLKIPDYVGNNMFNTLGNIYLNGMAGLLFVDFEKGRTLQLTGKAEILFDQVEDLDLQRTMKTGRYWFFDVTEWIITEHHHKEAWEFLENSPNNPEVA